MAIDVSDSDKELLLQRLAEQSEEIRAVPIVAAELAAARAATVAQLRALGVTLRELAEVMGVGVARAGQIADRDTTFKELALNNMEVSA